MAWRPLYSQHGPEPPGGEYVVRHERPFPARLDRAFQVGAIVAAAGVLTAGLAALVLGLYGGASLIDAWIPVVLSAIVAALAYGFTRAVGMIAVGVVGGLRRKAYVVDWQDDPPGR